MTQDGGDGMGGTWSGELPLLSPLLCKTSRKSNAASKKEENRMGKRNEIKETEKDERFFQRGRPRDSIKKKKKKKKTTTNK